MKEDIEMPLQDREGQEPTPQGAELAPFHQSGVLYITLGPAGALKIGTCSHCVVEEQGRPERAWDADGDKELDFDRETLFAALADLGIVLINRQAYVCP